MRLFHARVTWYEQLITHVKVHPGRHGSCVENEEQLTKDGRTCRPNKSSPEQQARDNAPNLDTRDKAATMQEALIHPLSEWQHFSVGRWNCLFCSAVNFQHQLWSYFAWVQHLGNTLVSKEQSHRTPIAGSREKPVVKCCETGYGPDLTHLFTINPRTRTL